jgi:hypothetical protein
MKHKFCCEASRGMYEDYYSRQAGNGAFPVYQGARSQRGHGLGSILSGFFRSALPLLKRGLSIFGREALRTGAQVANDVAEGQNFGDSAKKRVIDRINSFAPGLVTQSGSGIHRKRTYRKKPRHNTKRRKVQRRIFD